METIQIHKSNMTTQTAPPPMAIELPPLLYQRLQRLSELTHRPLQRLVIQTLENNVPVLPDDLPEQKRQLLIQLEALDDEMLWQVAYSRYLADKQREYSRLLAQHKTGSLSEVEQIELEQHQEQANQLMLRKSYAFVLLKWRGYTLPTLAELEANQS